MRVINCERERAGLWVIVCGNEKGLREYIYGAGLKKFKVMGKLVRRERSRKFHV